MAGAIGAQQAAGDGPAALLVVLPLLVVALLVWGDVAYDRLLITKVRSDLAVARGYFDQVMGEVGGGTRAVAASHVLLKALAVGDAPALAALLERQRAELGLDFLVISAAGTAPLDAVGATARGAHLAILDGSQFEQLAPLLSNRIRIPIIATRNAAPSERKTEDRAMVVLARADVIGDKGKVLAAVNGGVLLNQNLPFIDHINRIVYPQGSLPFGSQGTATLFMDDVRITTNVRLFKENSGRSAPASRSGQRRRAQAGRHLAGPRFRGQRLVRLGLRAAGRRARAACGHALRRLPRGAVPAGEVRDAASIGVIFLVVMTLAALFSLRWACSIFGPVERMNRTMLQVEQDTAARASARWIRRTRSARLPPIWTICWTWSTRRAACRTGPMSWT